MSDGLSVGWTGTKIAELTNDNKNSTVKLTLAQASFIGTLPVYVYPLVMPLGIYSSNHLGRKWTIIWGAFCTLSSWLFLILTEQIEYIYVAAVLRGFGGFIIYSVTEIYIAEISQVNIRGLLSTFIPILMNLGILLSYIGIAVMSLQDLAIFGTVVIGLMFPLFVWAPETPYFYLLKNKVEEANKSLRKFRNKDDIQEELDDIKTTIDKNNLEGNSFKQFFTDKTNMKISFIVWSTQIFQQLAGIDAILIYLQVILQSSGSSLSSNYSSIIFGTAKLIACCASLVLIDKIGRRSLLIFSCSVASFAPALLGIYFYIKDIAQYDISTLSWIPLTILIIYVLGYNVGLGTVPFILASEMYPTKFKALGVSCTQIMYCVSMLFAAELFALLKDNYGFHAAFWLLSAMTVVGLLFSIFCVYETKGKTFTQILSEIEDKTNGI